MIQNEKIVINRIYYIYCLKKHEIKNKLTVNLLKLKKLSKKVDNMLFFL
ncbi:hypothetical protein GCM10011346_01120 [Oceanobacillus neutriphilus]|uniref:Uncharacterized protein n=1 Tax=Oceanobacillus neutriphilus TaxID=531815 RepID=A0ABQ2NNV0_9BACI|nr:hypothetical protein GCM10011346_01120 [Oceanobacillus neutriphilus]